MNPFLKFLNDHHELVLTFAAFATMAAISTMPKQWTGFGTLWSWFYDWSHELVSALSQKYSTQLKAAEGQVPPAPTPMQQAEPPIVAEPAVKEIHSV